MREVIKYIYRVTRCYGTVVDGGTHRKQSRIIIVKIFLIITDTYRHNGDAEDLSDELRGEAQSVRNVQGKFIIIRMFMAHNKLLLIFYLKFEELVNLQMYTSNMLF